MGYQEHRLGARGSTPQGVRNIEKEWKQGNEKVRTKLNYIELSLVCAGYDSTEKRVVLGQGDERGSLSGSGKWTAWHDGGLGFFGGEGEGTWRHGRDPAARGEGGVGMGFRFWF